MWGKLIGKKIVAYRGYEQRKEYNDEIFVNIDFIFFDDEETFIRLKAQDKYDYHDCCSSAREIDLVVDKKQWKNLMENLKEPTNLSDPFWT